MNYFEYARSLRRINQPELADKDELIQTLLRYATLAPSGHNTQSWCFRVEGDYLYLLADLNRRTAVVDPDDHHLFVSLGCAAENLALAAAALGVGQDVETIDGNEPGYRLLLKQSPTVPSPLFDAITQRQSTRSEYDGSSVDDSDLNLLEQVGNGNGVSVRLLTRPDEIAKVLELMTRANAIQIKDRSFRRELESWIRFSDAEAIKRGDGLSARVTGNPACPRGLGKWLFRASLRAGSENAKLTRQVISSAGLAVLISEGDDPRHWAQAGRNFQRLALQATALGLKHAFLNQVVEVASVRAELASFLEVDSGRPDLLIRFGRAPLMPYSLRRPLSEVFQ